MNKPKKLSLEEHLEMVEAIKQLNTTYTFIYNKCINCYPKSHSLIRYLSRSLFGINGLMKLKGILSDEYDKTITPEEYSKYGRIYYKKNKEE